MGLAGRARLFGRIAHYSLGALSGNETPLMCPRWDAMILDL